ncbi:MAG: cadherin-like beta sandwich domain-containing protein [Acidimicrobiia bacterium]|nr:cadherin-like beta sandwich domain-containing protein [Acidimicrobiia bacterium]
MSGKPTRGLFGLLPVLALLLTGAIGLVQAAPAEAQSTLGPLPALVARATASQTLVLNWMAPTVGTATGYNVHYTAAPASGAGAVGDNAAAGTGDPLTSWVFGNFSGGTSTTQTFTGLTDGQAYRFRVRATASGVNSEWAFATGTPMPVTGLVSFQLNTLLTVESDSEPEEIVVLLSPAQTHSVTVGIIAVDVNTIPADYSLVANSVTFAPGETQKTFGITATADLADDGGNEVVILRLSPPTNIGVGASHYQNEMVIVDDSLEPFSLNVSAGARQLALFWPASPTSSNGFHLHYTASSSVADDAAASGSDPSAGWVEVSLSEATTRAHKLAGLTDGRTYRLRLRPYLVEDSMEVPGDWVFATGTPGSPVSWQGYDLTLSVDRQPSEKGADVVVTLDLGRAAPPGFWAQIEGLPSGSASYGLATSLYQRGQSGRLTDNLKPKRVDARIGMDWTMIVPGRPQLQSEQPYGSPGQRFDLAANLGDWNGAQTKTIRLRTIDDPWTDPGETIVLRATGYNFSVRKVGNPWTGYGFSELFSNTLTLTINDDDSPARAASPLQVGVLNALVYETDGATNNAPVTVWLSRPASHDVTVDYATTAPNAARPGVDFEAVSGTVTIPEGETRAEVIVPILDDGLEDSGETFLLELSNPSPSSVRVARASATVTIRNDETELADLTAQGGPGAKGPWTELDIGAFSPELTDYAVTVPYETTHVQLRATPLDEAVSLATGSGSQQSAVQSGRWGPSVALEVGNNTIAMSATGPSGDVLTYQVTVTREEWTESSDAELRSLLVGGASNAAGPWTKLDIGPLSPGQTRYAVTAPRGTTVARLLATPEDDAATLRSGTGSALRAVRSGFWSRGLPLTGGENTLTVEVTAEDGTTKTYTVTVTLPGKSAPTAASPITETTTTARPPAEPVSPTQEVPSQPDTDTTTATESRPQDTDKDSRPQDTVDAGTPDTDTDTDTDSGPPDIVNAYDADNNGTIDLSELLAAMRDYQNNQVTLPQLQTIIRYYLTN